MDSADTCDEEAPLVVANSRSQTITNHARAVHILSSAFLLIFLAYGAAQNLESTINTEEDLGTISLGILYLSFTFFSLVASPVVRLLGSKNALILGTTGYWLFIAANLMPTWYTMVPASLYMGFAASIIWVGQGTYLTSTARSHALDHNLHEGTVIGNFNGEFWGMFASHQLIGNLISLALLSNGTGGSASGTTLLFIVFLFSMTLGTILMCFLHKRDGKGGKVQPDSSADFYSSVVSLSKSVITPLFDVRMLLIIPLIAYSGLQQAFVWAEFTKYVVTPTLGVSGVGGAMAVYGAFDAICSLAAGRLTSGLSSITLIVCGGAFIQVIVLLWLLLKYSVTNGVLGTIYPLLMAAMLGIGDGVFNTQLSALLAILFKHDTEGAFAQFKVWQSASMSAVFFLSPYISLQAMLVIMLAALSISVTGFLYLTLQPIATFPALTLSLLTLHRRTTQQRRGTSGVDNRASSPVKATKRPLVSAWVSEEQGVEQAQRSSSLLRTISQRPKEVKAALGASAAEPYDFILSKIGKMEGLMSLRPTPRVSFQAIPSLNHTPKFAVRRSIPRTLMDVHRSCIRAQQSETKDGSVTLPPVSDSEENALKIKEWEVGKFQDEIAAAQGIKIRRRPPTGPPLHYVGPFQFRLQNEGNTPRNILEEIIWHKDVEVAQLKERKPLFSLKKDLDNAPPARDFIGALKASNLRTGLPGLIAEVKKASPSRGVIREDFDPVEIARAYEKGGAACLSVLTDEKYFQGSFENLEAIRSAGVKCPLLCKEFIIEAWQIYYARTKGADAILLIAAVLPDLDIRYMIKICKMLGLATLVEVHNEREMDRVLGIEGIELIGINNRDLGTFEVDISNTKKLLEGERGEMIRQKDIIVVGESGLFTPDDISYVQEAGVKAVLVGESIVKQSDPGKGITGLFGKDISI